MSAHQGNSLRGLGGQAQRLVLRTAYNGPYNL